MKRQVINKFRIFVIFSIFNLCCAAVVMAQPSVSAKGQTEKVLVAGNPSLKQSDVDELIAFFEWLFETRFTDQQRTKFQALAIKEWKSGEQAVKGMTEIIENNRKFQMMDTGRREKIRQTLTPEITASFKNEPSEVNTLLLEVYQNAEKNSAPDNKPGNSGNSGGNVSLADLAGTWSTSSVSGDRYKNLATGELSDAGGNIIEYIISPNGKIKYTGYMSTTLYACTTKLFVTKTGKISISGSNITFDYTSGERDYNSSCNSSLNGVKAIPPTKKTYPFTIERDEYGLKLCTLEEGNQFCIRKKS